MISRRALLGAGTTAAAYSMLHANSVFAESGAPWNQLGNNLQGDLVLPTDAAYATAKQLDVAEFDATNPNAIAYCVSASDVALCLKFAQDNELKFAVRSGGHSTGGYSTTTGLVIDVSRLNAITVGGSSVTIGTGAQNVDILNALAPSGQAVVGGACPTVSAGGFVQGGGLGFLTPALGVACDRVTSARVVLANGKTVTASAQQNSDLYWAIRGGGGGNFGVVTSYTMLPAALSLVAVARLQFGYDHAVDALDGFAQWLVGAPREIGGVAFVTLPDAAAGVTPIPAIQLVSTGSSSQLEAEVSRLLALTGAPLTQSVSVLPYRDLMMGVYQCSTKTVAQCHRVGTTPEGQLTRSQLGRQRTRMFSGPMSRTGWEQAVAVFESERVTGQLHQLQVLAIGGAAADLSRSATGYVHRDSLYTTNYVASIRETTGLTDEGKAAAQQWVTRGFDTIDPHSNGETYQNFIDPTLPDWQSAYYAENYPRLVCVKDKYDPHNAFNFAQSIG